jgi:hypothetical protein
MNGYDDWYGTDMAGIGFRVGMTVPLAAIFFIFGARVRIAGGT